MNEKSIEYDIGSDVACSDGQCGELRRVVVDPVAVAITHLVVEDKHREGVGHLVPIDLVESAEGEIRLRCTTAELRALDDAEEVRFLPGGVGTWGYTQDEMFSLPYYGLAGGGSLGLGGIGVGAGPQPIISDRVPAGEVEVRRGDHVHATDGEIGRVQGLAIDPADHHVTHVLLEEGHLWGKKRVALPITSVSRIDDEVQVGLTKDEIRDLPSIDLDERE
jgi:sporulation protein YlmC with PRC-barrel domain